MKTIYFKRRIITWINSNSYTSKATLSYFLNIHPKNIQIVVREFNDLYPDYKILINNSKGYYCSKPIPANIIESLHDDYILEVHLSIICGQLIKQITDRNYKVPKEIYFDSFCYYRSTLDSTLKHFNLPVLADLSKIPLSDKIYLLSLLPAHIHMNMHSLNSLFFSSHELYSISSKELSNYHKIAFEKTNNILFNLEENYRTSKNQLIIFSFFFYSMILTKDKSTNFKFVKVFDYSFYIPEECDEVIFKSLMILELNLCPSKIVNNSHHQLILERVNSISFFPSIGLYAPTQADLIFNSFCLYYKYYCLLKKFNLPEYSIIKLSLIHIALETLDIPATTHVNMQIRKSPVLSKSDFYTCPFTNVTFSISKDVTELSQYTHNEISYIILPNVEINTLVTQNYKTMFKGAKTISFSVFRLNFICSTSITLCWKIIHRIRINYPNCILSIYYDLSTEIPTINTFSQINIPNIKLIPVRDKNGNYTTLLDSIEEY